MTEIHQLVSVSQARQIWQLNYSSSTVKTERIPLELALGRVLAEDVSAPEDVPGFSRSSMDGFAVRAQDTFGASEAMPAYLNQIGEIFMGQEACQPVKAGETIKIATGGMLPEGVNAVVMVEYTEELDSHNLGVVRPVAPGENIINRGEDIRAGQLLLAAGSLLRPQDLGAMAGIGVTQVSVSLPPRVGIISTGDEVVAPHKVPSPGQVRDINSYAIAAMVEQAGGKACSYGIIPDVYEDLERVVRLALEENDLVILSGGSSVGTKDNTAKVIQSLGDPGILVHGVSVKPGKPTIIGLVGTKPVFGLPGHPASALVIFDLFIKPVIWQNLGLVKEPRQAIVQAKFSRSVASASGREDYWRVALVEKDGQLWAEPILGKSGLISTMVKADGTVKIVEAKEGIAAGELVEVILF